MNTLEMTLYERPEYDARNDNVDMSEEYQAPLPVWHRLYNHGGFRRVMILTVLAILWQIGAMWADNPLMMPSLVQTAEALYNVVSTGEMFGRVLASGKVLIIGYSCGLLAASALVLFAMSGRLGADFLTTLAGMFNPLPALAVLPLALLWFGLGLKSIVFVMMMSVVWTVSLNTYTGFQTIPDTLRMAGQNSGMNRISYVLKVLVPAAFPTILNGLKLGWAFSWRTSIGAELIFGVSAGSGGLGWYIFDNRAQLETANVFAGLLVIIMVGLFVEIGIFRTIENATVRKWGMQQ